MSIYRDNRADIPEVLICSGLDPSGGAGFLADAYVVSQLGARPIGVVTSLTVQNTLAVQQVHPVDPEVVGAQLASVLGDIEVHAVKLGLIGSVAIAREISFGLDLTNAPVVWDPVGAPSRGRVPFDSAHFEAMREHLAPHLRLVTPNWMELEELVQEQLGDRDAAIAAARRFIGGSKIAVLIKGGHHDTGDEIVDILVDGDAVELLAGPRLGDEDVHGTGCALSTAIATQLAKGDELLAACHHAKAWVAARIAAPMRAGRGAPSVV